LGQHSKNHPKVVVLVLSYNGRHLLQDALSSYLANDYPNFEVALIDNGSKDGTRNYVRSNFPLVRVLRTEKNLGYSGGLNLGLEYAFRKTGADYALVTNNDVKADRRAISELVLVAEREESIGFVTGKVFYYEKPDVLQTVGKKEDPVTWNGEHIGRGERDRGQYDKVSERFFIDDIFTLVRKRLYLETGGYDPAFFLEGEEYDWQARAKKLGYRFMYAPGARIWHKESMTIGKVSPLKTYYDARNPMLVVLLHKSPAFFRRYFWHHFKYSVFRGSLADLKHRRFALAAAKWRGFFSGILWGVKNKKLTARHVL
jgi:GT2 family glycosyltransferase